MTLHCSRFNGMLQNTWIILTFAPTLLILQYIMSGRESDHPVRLHSTAALTCVIAMQVTWLHAIKHRTAK
jgi:hypothetical protein